MKYFIQKALICFLLLILITVQQNSTQQKITIQLDKIYNINLQKDQTKIYSVKIQNLQTNQSLFIQADSPYYDPYQIPNVVVSSQNDFQRICAQQNNQYVGICQIQNQNLKQNQIFDIKITCSQKCSINLQVHLDKQFQISLGQKIQIKGVSQMTNVQQLKIQVPKDLNFTDIMLIANVQNQNQATQGINMYINVGDQDVKVPTTENYQFKGIKVWGDGTGIFIGQDNIKSGQWIKILLVIGQGVNVEFYSQVSNGNVKQIILNTNYNEFNSQDESKVFILNLTNTDSVDNVSVIDSLAHKTIQLVFVIYSGSPQIRVGFDAQYINSLSNYDIEGTISYLITPQIRNKKNFTGVIYIQVSGYWTSDYYLSTFTVSDKFYKLADGIAQIVTVEPGEVQNFIYQAYLVISDNDDDSKKLQQQIQSFRVRISLVSGNAQLGIRRCLSMQRNNSLDCLVTDKTLLKSDEAVKKSFDQINITVRKDYSAYQLYFDYNATQCQLYKKFSNLTVYNCQFQIIVFSTSPDNKQQLIYTMTMYQNRQQAILKQGYIYKDYIYETTYHYYKFTLPSLDNIEQVTFYMTILGGDAELMGTLNQTWKYMEFKDTFQQKDIYTSFLNTLTFQKSKLTNTTFYIAIYAYEVSDITLSLVVKRKSQNNTNTGNDTTTKNDSSVSNKTITSTLYLTQGLSQKYSLYEGDADINFGFTSRQKNNISVELIEIQGTVEFHVHKQNSTDQIPCMNSVSAGELKCTFSTQQNQKYLINVKAINPNQIQTFSISYFYPQTCKQYMLNLPQFIYLEVNQTECSSYAITDKKKNLQIITSFSTLDLLATNVTFSLTFNDLHPIQFSGRHKEISADQLSDFCKSDTMDNCNMKISITGDPNFYVQFYFVVEQQGKQMAMFDGIVRKVIDQKMSQKKGKFFYYQVSSMKESIKIFTTNKDKVGYYIGAKFVDESQFISSPDSLYLPFKNLAQSGITKEQNIYETRLVARKGTSVIQIFAQDFKKYCTSCVMLISIYGLDQVSNQANIFEVQVTQQESFIYLGEQKTGFLSEDEIYTYDIYGNPNAEGILTIRDYNKESGKQKQCFIASVEQIQSQKMQQVKGGNIIIQKSTSTYKVFIQNTGQSICTYQISYSSLAHSVTVLDSFMPTQIKLQNSEAQYYLYNHLEYQKFQILNYVKSGDVKIAVNRVSSDSTIQTLINKNIDLYDYKSNSGDSFLQVTDQNNGKFCKNCYYLIAVKGDPSVLSQMAIAQGDENLGLTTYGILKQTLKKGQIQNYSFYSIIDFHIVLPLLFGQIKMKIKSPDGKIVYQNNLKMSIQIFVPKSASVGGQYIDYYDEKSKFIISIQAVKDSSYFISVKRKNVLMRIYEGIPINIEIKQNQSTTVEFVNINDKDNVAVLLQVNDQQIQYDDQFWLNVTGQVMRDGQTETQKLDLPTAKQSQSSFNYVFKSIKGTYFLTFKTQRTIKTSLLLSKQKLTHLLSSANNLFMEKGTFQIYTPGQNIMIAVDSCLSQVQVKASSKYTAISQVGQIPIEQSASTPKSVILQHANYGGHYIITAQNVEGQYFVQVNPKNPTDEILYVISYYYYDRQDLMPYKKVDINPQITYELTDDKIIFILSPARLISTSSASPQYLSIKPQYTLYISNSSQVISMNSKCESTTGFRLTQSTLKQSKDPIRFAVDLKTIQNEVGSSPVYYVSAKAQISFEGEYLDSGYPPYIDLAYTKFQMTKQTTRVEFKSQTTSKIKYILLWVVIPVLISSILFVLALKFCIKKYRQLYPDQLVQQDRQMGQSQGQMKDGVNSAGKASDSLTGT